MYSIKKLPINIAVFVLSTLMTCILIEIALRFTHHKARLNDYIRNYYVPDQVNGFDIAENFPPTYYELGDRDDKIWSNNLGCFDWPYNGERDFMLLVGDSFTWGCAPFQNTWGVIIEREIGMRVLKCGVIAYGSKQEKFKIEKILKKIQLIPKLIIMGYFMGNDLIDDYLFPNQTVVDGYKAPKHILRDIRTGEKFTYSKQELRKRFGSSRSKLKVWLMGNSIIYNLTKRNKFFKKIGVKLGIMYAPPETGVNIHREIYSKEFNALSWVKVAWEDHLKNLSDMKTLADKIGSRLLLVIIPTYERIYEFPVGNNEKIAEWDYPMEKLINFLRGKHIDFLDLTPILSQYVMNKRRRSLRAEDTLLYLREGHFNIRGHLLVGLSVTRCIIKNNLIYIQDGNQKLSNIEHELNDLNIN